LDACRYLWRSATKRSVEISWRSVFSSVICVHNRWISTKSALSICCFRSRHRNKKRYGGTLGMSSSGSNGVQIKLHVFIMLPSTSIT
jgi:hypothetical protein